MTKFESGLISGLSRGVEISKIPVAAVLVKLLTCLRFGLDLIHETTEDTTIDMQGHFGGLRAIIETKRHLGTHPQLPGNLALVLQGLAQRHREAGRCRRRDQLFGVGVLAFALDPLLEGELTFGEDPALCGKETVTAVQVALPVGFGFSGYCIHN